MSQSENKVTTISEDAGHRGIWQAWILLLIGLIITAIATYHTKSVADAAARQDFDHSQVWIMLLGGACISFLLTLLFFNLLNTRFKALQMARQLTAELRTSEEKYAKAFRASPEAISIVSIEDGRYIEVNDVFLEETGFKRDEVIGHTSTELNVWIDLDQRRQFLEKLSKTGSLRNFEVRYRIRSGEIRIFSVSSEIVELGGKQCSFNFIRNITGLKTAEERLANVLTMLEAAFEQTPVPMVLVSMPDAVLRIVNSACRDFLGISDEPSPVGLNLAEFKPSYQDLDSNGNPTPLGEAPLALALQGKRTITEQRKIVTKTGATRWGLVSGNPIYNNQGDLIAAYLVFPDITERKRAEELQVFLAQSSGKEGSSFFNSLAQYLAESLEMDFICIDRLEGDNLSARTVAVWCDGKFEDNVTYELKDTPCGEVVGKTVCCYPASVCQFFPRDQVLQDLRAESYIGVTLWSHTGQPIGLIAVISRKPLSNRPLAEAMLKLVAIRAAGEMERLSAEEAREALAKTIRQKNHELEGLIYVTSHDLRSPLLNIHGFSERLKQACETLQQAAVTPDWDESLRRKVSETGTGQIPKSLGFIQTSVEKMNRLIEGLLRLSRLGRSDLKPVPINLNGMIDSIRSSMAFQIQTSGAIIEVGELPPCEGDATLINQLFTNLLENALKYRDTKRPLHVRITGQRNGGQGLYTVADNGCGIPAPHLDKIWELFHRVSPEGTVLGDGIGLSLVRRITERHGGEVRVESVFGEGTSFILTLPLSSELLRVTLPTDSAG